MSLINLAVRLATTVAGGVLAAAGVHLLTDEALEKLLDDECREANAAGRRAEWERQREIDEAADYIIAHAAAAAGGRATRARRELPAGWQGIVREGH